MKHWPIKPLGEVTTCLDSQRIPIKEDDRRLGSVPYYGANGQVGWIDKAIFNEPLLLVAEDGGHFDQPERGVAYTIRGSSWINNHVHILRPDKSQVLLDFLGYYFRHFDFLPYITGTTRAKLTQRDLMRVEVPVAPLAEQEQIVKLLDEADALRKLRAEADRRTAYLIPALFNEMFGDPVENPKGYPIQPLEEVCSRITDGTHQPPPFAEKGIPFLFVRNIVSGFIDFDTEKFITEETFAKLTRRVKPERGDILYSTVGSYGVAVQVETDRKFTFQRHIGHLKPNRQQIDSGFLTAQLNTSSLKLQADQSARGIAQKTVNLAEIRKFKVIVPALVLQKKFATRAREIRGLEAEQAASRQRLDALFQSMLHRAFSGEL
jgi:type I restriction enzyme S subunit